MWWIQTTGYHLPGLIWLIVIAVIFVVAVIALSMAGAASRNARQTRRMVQDQAARHLANGATMGQGVAPPGMATPTTSLVASEDGPAAVLDRDPLVGDPGLGESMRILHERYARGEITREEYLQARQDMVATTH
jgi:Ni/Co efflux regulator RcnB